MASTLWSDDESAALRNMVADGKSDRDISEALPGRTMKAVRHRRHVMGLESLTRTGVAEDRQARREQMARIQAAADNPPIDTNDKETIRRLEAEIARLREQKKWETHSDAVESVGGLLTLRESDRHNCDENHLLSCCAALEEKFLVVVDRYRPDRIQLVLGDDWIAGRGIFREQDLQSAVADPEHQIKVGAVKFRQKIAGIRKITDAPIIARFLKGNHEMAPGKTELGPELFYRCRMLCEDIPGLKMTLHNHRAIVNLSHEGTHNVFAYHGFGHSKSSPNSPAFIDATKDDIIHWNGLCQPDERVRRVLSGHTHWASAGLERLRGVAYDTTGGLQRNNRVQLGKNSRPVGWIVYVSPRGMVSDIQQPILLQPDQETHDRELSDPHLGSANRADCAACLKEYDDIVKVRELEVPVDQIGVTDGRW